MPDVVSFVLQVELREGQLEAFRDLMNEQVLAAREEPGTMAYEWFISDDESSCHIYERYRDSAAVIAHLGTFGAHYAERFLACVQPVGLNVYGNPSADVRASLDNLGATYFGPFGGFAR